MGLHGTQILATLFDGITRHSPEGRWFQQFAAAHGFHEAVKWRDSGRWIPDGGGPVPTGIELEDLEGLPATDTWLKRPCWLASGGNGPFDVNQRAGRNRAATGQELARVVEEDDAVAQQAPPLLGVEGDDVGRVTVRAVSWRTWGLMWTHCLPLLIADVWGTAGPWSARKPGVQPAAARTGPGE